VNYSRPRSMNSALEVLDDDRSVYLFVSPVRSATTATGTLQLSNAR
jgi:hypothetical protein